jgi:hypothetical protein
MDSPRALPICTPRCPTIARPPVDAHQDSQRPARPAGARARGGHGHVGVGRGAPGRAAVAHRPPQPDARQGPDRDPARPPRRRHAAAGRDDADQDRQPHAQEHTAQAHDGVLSRLGERRDDKFDGLLVTGAPVELLEFEDVNYWDELCAIFDWTQSHVHSTFAICWGAQAALHHFHKVPKHALPRKEFGVYRHRNLSPASPYLRGVSDDFSIPCRAGPRCAAQSFPATPASRC